MKKWFAVLCFSIVGTAAFSQVDPHAGSQDKFLERSKSSIAEEVSNSSNQLKELRDSHAAWERELARSKVKASKISTSIEVAIERQIAKTMQAPHWPHWPGEGLQDAEVAPSSDRPSYYAEEEAYKNCDSIDACKMWAAEEAEKDVHFQVLSVNISVPDYHNRHVEVAYVMEGVEGKLAFEENFGNWKKLD